MARNLSPEESKRRSELMKRLNAEGRTGAEFGRKLGGRTRRGESREQALARRRAAWEAEKARKAERASRLESISGTLLIPAFPPMEVLEAHGLGELARSVFEGIKEREEYLTRI